MKSGKEVILSIDNKFKTLYGTVDHKNLKSIYLKILTWAEPIDSFDVYDSEISKLKKRFKNKLNDVLPKNKFKSGKYIVDFDIKNSGVRFGKKSYLNVSVTLFTNTEDKITSTDYKENMKILFKSLLEPLRNNETFNFNIKK